MSSSSVDSLLSGSALVETVDDVAVDAEHTLFGVDAAGVAVHSGPRPVLGASNPLAASVDADQYRLGRGPCLHAFHTNHVVLLDLDGRHRRWPAFEERAMSAGVRTVLSVPLRLDGDPIGSLNLYSRARGAYSAGLAQQAELFARPAALRLSRAGVAVQAAEAADIVGLELQDRGTVDQAIGVLMALHRDASVERARRRLEHLAADLDLDVPRTAARLVLTPPREG